MPSDKDTESVSSPLAPNGDERKIISAVKFLKDKRVQNSPLMGQVRFLKSKGLSLDEVHLAFEKAGLTKTMEELRPIFFRTQINSSDVVNTSAAPNSYGNKSTQQIAYSSGPRSPSISTTASGTRDSTWATWAVRSITSSLAIIGAYQLMRSYPPFEVRWKEESSENTVLENVKAVSRENIDGSEDVQQKHIPQLRESLTRSEEEVSRLRRDRVDLQSNAAKTRGELQSKQRKLEAVEAENRRLQDELYKKTSNTMAVTTTQDDSQQLCEHAQQIRSDIKETIDQVEAAENLQVEKFDGQPETRIIS